MRYALILLLVVTVAFVGCRAAHPPPEDAQTPAPTEPAIPNGEDIHPSLIVDDVGTVTFVDLEGGFYGIVTDDTTRYNPMELDEEYQEDGLRIRFRGYIVEDVATAQMWGDPIEVLEIMRLGIQPDETTQ